MHVIVTRRLTLRPPHWLDAEDIAAGLADWNVARMLGPVPFPYHLEDAEDWIGRCADSRDDLVYTIHRERLIGVVSVHGGRADPVLGYWLAAPRHGQGFMTEAAGALLRHAFHATGAQAIRSSVFLGNPASLRVQEKLGFRLTGVGEIYSRPRGAVVQTLTTRLTREDFEARTQTGALAFAA